MTQKVLGLDLGTNSIGSAVRNLDLSDDLQWQLEFFSSDIFRSSVNKESPQFRSIILCDLLLYIDVTFWYLSIDLGLFWGSWFLHRHKIPHPNPMGDMISTKKYCLFKEYFRVVCFICI